MAVGRTEFMAPPSSHGADCLVMRDRRIVILPQREARNESSLCQMSRCFGDFSLEQTGLKHYFMVPGDYNLVLLDELLSNENVQQIGCCNELNAAYAAEGYARVNGCGAVITTFNVGAFSALAGVAAAFAERLPVIFVSAGLNTNGPPANRLLHHTIATHDFSYQQEMFEKVTCASVRILHPDNAPAMIDPRDRHSASGAQAGVH